MGIGYEYRCDCGESGTVTLGAGFGYPEVLERAIEEIKAGKHGADLQEALLQNPSLKPDAQSRIFICEDCGFWHVDIDMSLVEEIDHDSASFDLDEALLDGTEVWDEWGTYMHLVKEQIPSCPKCKGNMHAIRVTEDDMPERLPALTCPACGKENVFGNGMAFDWD